jgi:uncharacterized protein (DUF433 family)
MDALLNRITVDAAVCHGKPCIRGLRYPVEMLLELRSGGMSDAEILADYDDLEPEDFRAVDFYRTQSHQMRSKRAKAV